MSVILRNPSNKTKHPLDLHPGNDFADLVHETFPLLPPSDDHQNLESRKRRKKQNDIVQDDAPEKPDWNRLTNFSASKDFLSSTTGGPSPTVDH